jgi:hypothetical protein
VSDINGIRELVRTELAVPAVELHAQMEWEPLPDVWPSVIEVCAGEWRLERDSYGTPVYRMFQDPEWEDD